jgi:hypothetical protein
MSTTSWIRDKLIEEAHELEIIMAYAGAVRSRKRAKNAIKAAAHDGHITFSRWNKEEEVEEEAEEEEEEEAFAAAGEGAVGGKNQMMHDADAAAIVEGMVAPGPAEEQAAQVAQYEPMEGVIGAHAF